MQINTEVVKTNIFFLNQGIDLLNSVTDEQYALNEGKYYKSGIGRHFRHILEHYISLINGHSVRVNYDERERNLKMETDRSYAISCIRNVIDSIEVFGLKPELIDKQIEVMSNQGIRVETTPWSFSSIRRELQFLISHTVHHYALIALILRTMNVQVPAEFGIAPSTLKYESTLK